MAETPGSKPGQKKLMKKLKASQTRNTVERLTRNAKSKSGTVSRMTSALKDSGAKVNPSKYKPLGNVKKLPGTSLVRAEPRSLAVVKEGVKDIVKYNVPKTALATVGESAPGVVRSGLSKSLGLLGRVAGPAGALFAMTTPTGDKYDDKPVDKPMRGRKIGTLKQYDSPIGPKQKDEGRRIYTGKVGPDKPAAPKAAPAKKEAAPKAAERKKVVPVPKMKPGPYFKGNWRGAAPTDVQARGSARVKRRSFADIFKKD